MSLTEYTLAKNRLRESFNLTSTMVAFCSLLVGGITEPPVIKKDVQPYYKIIEVSGAVSQASKIAIWGSYDRKGYYPKTELGKKLMTLRNQAIAKGLPLLNADEIIEEISRRRGEID